MILRYNREIEIEVKIDENIGFKLLRYHREKEDRDRIIGSIERY